MSTKFPPTSQGGVRWRKPVPVRVSPEAALKVLGPEEQAIRAGLEVSLQRAQEEAKKPIVEQRSSRSPDSVVAAAREKVAKLEKVLVVLEGTSGAEVDAVRNALDKARVVAQEKPLAEQILECKGFVERAEKRLLKLEAERVAEIASLEQGRARLVRLKAEAAGQLPVPPPPTAVAELEAEVSRLRSELAATRTAPPTDQPGDQPAKKQPRLREDFVPTQSRRRGCG